MEKVLKTIDDVKQALKVYRESHPEEDSSYNVFKVLQIEYREVLMCRILADLLNPEGSHKAGRTFLDSFIQRVVPHRFHELQSKQIHVHKEYTITEERRIDIVIYGEDVFIPIEVKINAYDQENQCFDYYHYAIQRDLNTQVIYLTKHGTFPPEESTYSKDKSQNIGRNQVVCVSFANDILLWLQEIEKMIENPNVNMVVHQYSDAIKEVCRNEVQNETDSVVEVIVRSEDNFRSALQIVDTINDAKAEIMQKLFADLEQELDPVAEKYGLKKKIHFVGMIIMTKLQMIFIGKGQRIQELIMLSKMQNFRLVLNCGFV